MMYKKSKEETMRQKGRPFMSQSRSDKISVQRENSAVENSAPAEEAVIRIISEERRTMLDALYKAFEIVSEGTYVYLCDMKYDFSRWSKSAVDTYGLPSEYMYGAGDI